MEKGGGGGGAIGTATGTAASNRKIIYSYFISTMPLDSISVSTVVLPESNVFSMSTDVSTISEEFLFSMLQDKVLVSISLSFLAASASKALRRAIISINIIQVCIYVAL